MKTHAEYAWLPYETCLERMHRRGLKGRAAGGVQDGHRHARSTKPGTGPGF
ncbi:hypothetical protein TBR22_A00840 [Luteitalea sp. TBR-22]|nr:hypothetical protein TBR22_A00840 [Luteitalea sp. TBR-22]